jgi:hypothetical protein
MAGFSEIVANRHTPSKFFGELNQAIRSDWEQNFRGQLQGTIARRSFN